MIEFIHRHILLPTYEAGLKRRRVFQHLKDLERTQWQSSEELERLQFDALRRLLRHAGEFCPYYREHWCGLDLSASDLRTLDDFHRFPVTTREAVRENRMRMRSTAPGTKLLSKSTGGSTGVPLHFDYDFGSLDRRFAAWHRGYSWAGAGPGTKQFYFWGVPLGRRSFGHRLKDDFYNRIYRRLVVSSFDFRETDAAEVVSRYNRYRPAVLVAYTNPLYYLARTLEENKIVPHAPKSIVVGAEKLHDFQRKQIERVFQAPVFETYGTREFMLLGAECERHQGLHLNVENILLEILGDDGAPTPAGEEGNIVVTDLTNYGMPFIRYANGDRAVAGWKTCACGRGLPLLQCVTGRRLDVLRTPDGRFVPGEFFPHLVKDHPEVRRFQVVQTAIDRVQMRAVPNGEWSAESRAALRRDACQILGPHVHFELIQVDRIELTPSGKHQVVLGLSENGTETTPHGSTHS